MNCSYFLLAVIAGEHIRYGSLSVQVTGNETDRTTRASTFCLTEQNQPVELRDMEVDVLVTGTPSVDFELWVDVKRSRLSRLPNGSASTTGQVIGFMSMEVLSFVVGEEEPNKHPLALSVANMETHTDGKYLKCNHGKSQKAYLLVSRSCSQLTKVIETGLSAMSDMERLSFTKSGELILSTKSRPAMREGRWYSAVILAVTGSSKWRSQATIPGMDNFTLPCKGFKVSLDELPSYNYAFALTLLCLMTIIPSAALLAVYQAAAGRGELTFKSWVALAKAWFLEHPKTYAYQTAIVGCVLAIGALQIAYLQWHRMISSGDRDLCVYNEKCYRPSGEADIPLNNILSNLPYVIHGILLAIHTSILQARSGYNADCLVGVKEYFSLSYALAWALLFEGVFSAIYHLCPSPLVFQFDIAFMYVLSGLMMIALLQPKQQSRAGDEYQSDQITLLSEEKKSMLSPLHSPKFFLFIVAPVLVFDYLDSVQASRQYDINIEQAGLWAAVLVWEVMLMLLVARGVGLGWRGESRKNRIAFSLYVAFWVLVLGYGLEEAIFDSSDSSVELYLLASVLLATCLTVMAKSTECVLEAARKELYARTFALALFLIVMVGCWIGAIYVFYFEEVTDKLKHAEESRELNQKCVLFNFFDYHDVWHLLSSTALFLSILFIQAIHTPLHGRHTYAPIP